jgi:methylglutaconyl-CoA hydratase
MLEVDVDGSLARVTLNRPEVHNAFNQEMVEALRQAFEELGAEPGVRVITLEGRGRSFSAGGDLNWMRESVDYSFEENVADALRLAAMFRAIALCPKPVIARVHGAALGGGSGLVASADIAVALESARFGFTEVRLGLVPGVISPFVIARIGAGRAREYFITGERFSARTAQSIGLIHATTESVEELDAAVRAKIDHLLEAAPEAVAETKRLIRTVSSSDLDAAIRHATEALARARRGEEGQAGLHAFLNREKPPWIEA